MGFNNGALFYNIEIFATFDRSFDKKSRKENQTNYE